MPPADVSTDTTETLVGMVEQHAQRRPDEIAIHFGERHWSWAQWASRIRQAAGALRATGLQRGQVVAFLDKNHPGCLETLLAATSIGVVATIV
ncbi:MAG TPA: AMP-binding protein, partial [Mycobacterium sp.]|nr:AMP-binding protein [Mycobacterium sp.]